MEEHSANPPPANRDYGVLLGELKATAKAVHTGLQSLNEEVKGHGRAISGAAVALEHAREQLIQLSKILRDGNGQSVLSRMAIYEQGLKDVTEELDQVRRDMAGMGSEARTTTLRQLAGLEDRVDELEANLDKFKTSLEGIEQVRQSVSGGWQLAMLVLKFIFHFIVALTAILAAYAAFG